LAALHAGDSAQPAAKPNVVYILADDLGWGDLSAHGGGVVRPNIDRLFKQGVKLRNFMGWCVCSPTRTMLLTGRHPSRVGTGPEVGGELAKEETTIAEGLKDFSPFAEASLHAGQTGRGTPAAGGHLEAD
jgi:arylsulfatase A-like enzyme